MQPIHIILQKIAGKKHIIFILNKYYFFWFFACGGAGGWIVGWCISGVITMQGLGCKRWPSRLLTVSPPQNKEPPGAYVENTVSEGSANGFGQRRP